jgi:hypothetical protein
MSKSRASTARPRLRVEPASYVLLVWSDYEEVQRKLKGTWGEKGESDDDKRTGVSLDNIINHLLINCRSLTAKPTTSSCFLVYSLTGDQLAPARNERHCFAYADSPAKSGQNGVKPFLSKPTPDLNTFVSPGSMFFQTSTFPQSR